VTISLLFKLSLPSTPEENGSEVQLSLTKTGKHMRNIVLIGIAVMLCLSAVLGQDQLKGGEVFAGYQLLHLDSLNANGWNAAVTGNVNRWFGVTGDVSGTYKGAGHLYSFMGGPTFSVRTKRMTPFVHLLFGVLAACESSCGVRSQPRWAAV
jgi:hypothetical protein